MADRNLPDYPQPFGTRKICISTHQGPVAYVQGGEVVSANALFGSNALFDAAWTAGVSFNANNQGNYRPIVLPPTGQSPAVSNNNLSQFAIPAGSNNVTIQWLAANGTEAANNTNLSSEFVRMVYIGG